VTKPRQRKKLTRKNLVELFLSGVSVKWLYWGRSTEWSISDPGAPLELAWPDSTRLTGYMLSTYCQRYARVALTAQAISIFILAFWNHTVKVCELCMCMCVCTPEHCWV
jgi:hypothetical protein